ncbi:MAG: beta-phosphoglucomutase [Tenuifilaceae bacterium]
MNSVSACIFDLDGVVVDTAKYHFLAWKRLASELGFEFHEKDNERLKGVSRMDSLNILLEIGGIKMDQSEKEKLAYTKNQWYLDYISKMKPDEILPGVRTFIQELRKMGIRIGLGSASKNAPLILNQIEVFHLFDVIVDGSMVVNAKPDPEIFLQAAKKLGVDPKNCVVFEDAEAGIDASISAGIRCIGVGNSDTLRKANAVIPDFNGMSVTKFFMLLND